MDGWRDGYISELSFFLIEMTLKILEKRIKKIIHIKCID